MGYINHKSNDKINLIKGNIIKLNILDLWGKLISLENNLIASEKGCNNPIKPTILGPLRNWI